MGLRDAAVERTDDGILAGGFVQCGDAGGEERLVRPDDFDAGLFDGGERVGVSSLATASARGPIDLDATDDIASQEAANSSRAEQESHHKWRAQNQDARSDHALERSLS